MKKIWEIFWRFLALGCVSFGGPAAHLGYFRTAFVEKLKWLNEPQYARIIALSQFLPGPGSSQTGFAIGLQRAGIWGGIAAFTGFTLPSFLLMYLLGSFLIESSTDSFIQGVIHGLKLLAVVVVADATYGMYCSFCKTKLSTALACTTACALLFIPNIWTQLGLLVLAAMIGSIFYGSSQTEGAISVSPKQSTPQKSELRVSPLLLFFALLLLPVAIPILSQIAPPTSSSFGTEVLMFSQFYQAGSMVFGGGHVVLPLLQELVGESMSNDSFLLGYAAAQAVPGPMFTFATYLGVELLPESEFLGACLATVAIFLPGFLLVIALHRSWENLASKPQVAGAAWGINASVVGLLIAALYNPVFTSAVNSRLDMAFVIAGIAILRLLKPPILVLVLAFAFTGALVAV